MIPPSLARLIEAIQKHAASTQAGHPDSMRLAAWDAISMRACEALPALQSMTAEEPCSACGGRGTYTDTIGPGGKIGQVKCSVCDGTGVAHPPLVAAKEIEVAEKVYFTEHYAFLCERLEHGEHEPMPVYLRGGGEIATSSIDPQYTQDAFEAAQWLRRGAAEDACKHLNRTAHGYHKWIVTEHHFTSDASAHPQTLVDAEAAALEIQLAIERIYDNPDMSKGFGPQLREAIAAILKQRSQERAGWVLVPEKLSARMREAMSSSMNDVFGSYPAYDDQRQDIWSAILAAAPASSGDKK